MYTVTAITSTTSSTTLPPKPPTPSTKQNDSKTKTANNRSLSPVSLPTATSIVQASTTDKKWATQTTVTTISAKTIPLQQPYPVSTSESKSRSTEFSEKYKPHKDLAPNINLNLQLAPTTPTTKSLPKIPPVSSILLPKTTTDISSGKLKILAEHDRDIRDTNLLKRHTLSYSKK